MYHFCTYFDVNYLAQGITLYRSLSEHCDKPFRFYILCLDEETFDVLQRLNQENIIPIAMESVEEWDVRLLSAKENRSRIEYYFTLSPALPAFVMENFEHVDCVSYLDADLFFFASPKPIFEELGDASILIIGHRFSKHLKQREVCGLYNVQYLTFRNDAQGRGCLEHWRNQCIEWCHDRLEDGKYADQKYLNAWPELYDRLIVSQLKGAGLAPWNVHGVQIKSNGKGVTVDGEPLIFFHFHGFKWLGWTWCKTGFGCYYANIDQRGKKLLFTSYLKSMKETARLLSEKASFTVSPYQYKAGVRYAGTWFKNVRSAIRNRDYFSPWIRRI